MGLGVHIIGLKEANESMQAAIKGDSFDFGISSCIAIPKQYLYVPGLGGGFKSVSYFIGFV